MAIHKIKFHGVVLIGVTEGDAILIPLKPISDAMGLAWTHQLQSIKGHPVLAKGMTLRVIPYGAGGNQEMVCLPLRRLNFWLGRIHPERFENQAVRDRVIIFQEECADKLADHFLGKSTAQPSAGISTTVVQPDLFDYAAQINELKNQINELEKENAELKVRVNALEQKPTASESRPLRKLVGPREPFVPPVPKVNFEY